MATSFITKRVADSAAPDEICALNQDRAQRQGEGIRIVIAEEYQNHHESLRSLIGSQPGVWVACESSVGAEVVRLVRELKSDTLLILAPRKSAPFSTDQPDISRTRDFGLTPREQEITKRVASGSTNKELGQEFKISERTVKHHLTNIFDKLGICSRLQLAVFAFEHGLANPTEV